MDTGSAKELAVTAKLSKSYKQVKESSDIESEALQTPYKVCGVLLAMLVLYYRASQGWKQALDEVITKHFFSTGTGAIKEEWEVGDLYSGKYLVNSSNRWVYVTEDLARSFDSCFKIFDIS